jgi:membrane fusion protein (multidrug efflux system)
MFANANASPSSLAPSGSSSQPNERTAVAPRASQWGQFAVKLPWLAVAAVVVTFSGVVGFRIYAPTPDVWTDDAYLEAHYATIAPRVAGQVVAVKVDDEERVKAGQLLVKLDDRDYQVALATAEAQIAAARASIESTEAQIDVQQAQIALNTAQIQQQQASLTYAEQQSARYGALARDGWGTVQNAQQWVSQQRQGEASVKSAQQALVAAQRQLAVLKAQHATAEANLAQASAQRDQAKLNLSYTKIRAPVDGMIAERSVQVGNYVSPGTGLMAMVPLSQVYVVANYREVQLEHVKAGQPATIHVDAYNIDLAGTVLDVPAATGTTFTPLQPHNATGNFTKIVQRLPVKIELTPGQPLARLLRVGLSVETTIHTKFADVVAVARDGREEGPSIPHRHDACPADANSANCE